MKTSVAFAVVALIPAALLSACGSTPSATSGNTASQAASTDSTVPMDGADTNTQSDSVDCVDLKTKKIQIETNYPSYSGDSDPTDTFVTLQVSITNNCAKDIRGVQVKETVNDLFGTKIFAGNGSYSISIPVGQTMSTPATRGFQFNQFEDAHSTLATVKDEDLSVDYSVTKIVFTDKSVATP